MKKVELEQGTPEWLAWRKGGLGASNAAAVIGVCKFNTPYELFMQMTGRLPAFEGNRATEAGNEMEPKARASYEIEHDFVDMPATCVEHPVHSEIRASLDGLREDGKVILEIKYPSQASHDIAVSGMVPEHYYPQCQHQLMCVPEAEELHYWSFREEKGVKVVVYPDPIYQRMLLEAELAFLDLVKNATPPPLMDRDAKLVDDAVIKDICQRLIELKDTKGKEAKEESDSLKSKVIELGGHGKVRCENVLISKSLTKTGKESYRMTVSKSG